MRTDAQWFPMYAGAFQMDTNHLSLAQTGAYIRLLNTHWHRGSLPNDAEDLAHICGASLQEWQNDIAPKVLPFLTETNDGKLVQKRMLAELSRASKITKTKAEISAQKSWAGQVGAARRWGKPMPSRPGSHGTDDRPMAGAIDPAIAPATAPPLEPHGTAAVEPDKPAEFRQAEVVADPLPPDAPLSENRPVSSVPMAPIAPERQEPCKPVPLPIQVQVDEAGKTDSLAALRALAGSADADFDSWWAAYPRKVGKGAAKKAWKFALGKTDAATMISALANQIAGGTFTTESRYVPHPATWLGAERWSDEVEGTDGFDPVLRAAGLTPEDYADGGEIIDITTIRNLRRC